MPSGCPRTHIFGLTSLWFFSSYLPAIISQRTDDLRELGARYWNPAVSLIATLLAGLNIIGITGGGHPSPTSRWVVLVSAVVVLVLIRFRTVAIWITKIILPSDPPPPNPTLFRGLLSYQRGERVPGRDREIDECVRRIRGSSLFILDGETGCGKTSILNSALIPATEGWAHVVEVRLEDAPFQRTYSALNAGGATALPEQIDTDLLLVEVDKLRTSRKETGPESELVIVFDQFEELFVHSPNQVRHDFAVLLRELISTERARVVITIRTDFLDLLTKLCHEVDPDHRALNLGNYFPLKAFRREVAQDVIESILEQHIAGDPIRRQKAEKLANLLATELLRPPRDVRLPRADPWSVLPVELQSIGLMLELSGLENLSVDGYLLQGGRAGLLRAFIEDAKTFVYRSVAVGDEITLLILRELISAPGTKQPRSAGDLRKARPLSAVSEDTLRQVLRALEKTFLVKVAPNSDRKDRNARYELVHEYLVNVLSEAPDPFLQKVRDAQERIQFWLTRTRPQEVPHASNSFRGKIRLWFAQPIPITETMRLRRFAATDEARNMFDRNLRGYMARIFAVFLPVTLLIGTAWAWEWSDQVQIDSVVEAGTAEAASIDYIMASDELEDWATTLARTGRAQYVLDAVRQNGGLIQRASLLSRIAIHVMALDSSAIPITLLQEAASVASDQEISGIENLGAFRLAAERLGLRSAPDTALALASVSQSSVRPMVFAAVGEGLARAGVRAKADYAVTQAIRLAVELPERTSKVIALNLTARSALDSELNTLAASALANAKLAATQLPEEERIPLALDLATTLMRSGDARGADTLLGTAFEVQAVWRWRSGRESLVAVGAEYARKGHSHWLLTRLRALPSTRRVEIAPSVLLGLAQGGRADSAFAFVESIPDDSSAAIMVAAVTTGIARRGAPIDRGALVPLLKTPVQRLSIPDSVLTLLFKSGDRSTALALASRGDSAPSRNAAVTAGGHRVLLAFLFAKANHVDSALLVARQIEQQEQRCDALLVVSETALRNHVNLDRNETLAQCLPLLSLPLPNAVNGVRTIDVRARILVELVTPAGGLRDAVTHELLPETRDRVLARASELFADSKRFREAVYVSSAIRNSEIRSEATTGIGIYLAESDSIASVRQILRTLPFRSDQSTLRVALTDAYARAQHYHRARTTATACLPTGDRLRAYTLILQRYHHISFHPDTLS